MSLLAETIMLARYKINRGRRPPSDPLPDGIRKDIRWRTSHVLRPGEGMVKAYLVSLDEKSWRTFRKAYRALLEERYRKDRTPFDELARAASEGDVFIGCSCPTKANPRVDRCHTVLALEFMKHKYPKLQVKFPPQ